MQPIWVNVLELRREWANSLSFKCEFVLVNELALAGPVVSSGVGVLAVRGQRITRPLLTCCEHRAGEIQSLPNEGQGQACSGIHDVAHRDDLDDRPCSR